MGAQHNEGCCQPYVSILMSNDPSLRLFLFVTKPRGLKIETTESIVPWYPQMWKNEFAGVIFSPTSCSSCGPSSVSTLPVFPRHPCDNGWSGLLTVGRYLKSGLSAAIFSSMARYPSSCAYFAPCSSTTFLFDPMFFRCMTYLRNGARPVPAAT